MISRPKLNLKHRLTLTGVLVALLPFPLLTLILLNVSSFHRQPAIAVAAKGGLTPSDLDHAVDSAYRTAEFSQQELSHTLLLAQRLLASERGIRQSKSRQVLWASAGSSAVKLPLLMIRKIPLLPSANPRRAFVNEFSALSGVPCGILQRVNEAGDMLWIASSLTSAGGKLLLGTVLPATDPAVRAALDKRPYTGTSQVGGDRRLSAYQPISRADGATMGMLAVSLREASEAEQIRQALAAIHVGSQGEIFAGPSNLPIPASVIDEARNQPFRTIRERYQLASKGEMVAHVRYFAPWNWQLGVAVPVTEMAVAAAPAKESKDRTATGVAIALLISLVLSAVIWWRSSAILSSRLMETQATIKGSIEALLGIGNSPAPATQARSDHGPLLADANRTANLMLTGVGETMLATRDCNRHAEKACGEVEAMQRAMAELSASNSQVSGLVKDISGIALQSRLLALNASIEAARAGQHGAAFNVVADEFGKLALRCSENAKSTTALLTNSVAMNSAGTEYLARLDVQVGQFSRRAETATQSLAELLRASNQQKLTISTLERRLTRVEKAADPTGEIRRGVFAEVASLEQNAIALSDLLNGAPKTKKSRQGQKARSSDLKAPTGNRSAHRAC